MFNKKKILLSFLYCERGNVIIMTGLFIMALFAIAGAGLDFGRAYLFKTKYQQALDLAGLAAANPAKNNPDIADRQTAANMYYNLNFPASYLGKTRPSFTLTQNTLNMEISGNTSLDTNFIGTVGQDKLKLSAASKVDIPGKAPKFDVILVLDVSDSMDWQFDGDKCTQFATTPCNDNDGNPATAGYPYCYDTTGNYYSCAYASRFHALTIAAKALSDTLLDDTGSSPNRVAAVTWNDQLVEVNDFVNKTTGSTSIPNFLSYYNNTKIKGATDSTKGLEAAKSKATEFRADTVRVVVLLTDGENNGGKPGHDLDIDNASIAICNELKAMTPPTIIYTIALGDIVKKDIDGNFINTGGVAVEQFLRTCASGNVVNNLNKYYFVAPDGTQLKNIFTAIAENIQKLRITN
ncbi:MAG: VWA domain-containing protein [Rickettsiales bacterium]